MHARLNVGLPKFFCVDVDLVQAAMYNQELATKSSFVDGLPCCVDDGH